MVVVPTIPPTVGGGGGVGGGEGEKTGVTGKWRRMGGTYHIVEKI